MLGIIGAMQQEVAELKALMEEVTTERVAGMEFFKGKLEQKEVVVVQSGIGKVNAALCVQVLADRYPIDGIVNTGIAGSLDATIDIGDIVLSTDAVEHDMDVTAFGYPYGQVPGTKDRAFVADARLLEIAKEASGEIQSGIKTHIGRIATGDQFIAQKEKKEWIQTEFEASCTEMEGAAIAHAAVRNEIPFLIVRAISDKADNSAEMDYETFEKMAIENSICLMIAMLKRL